MAKSLAIASLQILSVLLLASLAQSRIVYTNLTVFEHDGGNLFIVTGIPNRTWGADQFGSVFMADNIATLNVSVTSTSVGRFHGIAAVASLDGTTLQTASSLQFTSGQYIGSTLEFAEIIVGTLPINEVPIVGGTKDFRYANGYMTSEFLPPFGEVGNTLRLHLFVRQDIPDDYLDIAIH